MDWAGETDDFYERDIPGVAENLRLLYSHPYYNKVGDISDLTGIEHFANLRCLNCSGQNLRGELDLTALMKLDSLDCSNNRLTDLKVNLVAHDWWDNYRYNNSNGYQLDVTKDLAHQRVYLNCSNNYLTHLNNVTVTPTAVGQLVNFEGSYANNRILAFPIGKHPYYDLQQGIFAYGEIGNTGYWWHGPEELLMVYTFPRGMNDAQKAMFGELGIPCGPYDWNEKTYDLALYLHPYGFYEASGVSFHSISGIYENVLSGFYSSGQDIGVNLSVIDKDRSRVGISVPDNLRDEESRFPTVAEPLGDYNVYPEKVKLGDTTYYVFNESGSTADIDYCHGEGGQSGLRLFNGYTTWIDSDECGMPQAKWLTNWRGSQSPNYDWSFLGINKYADWFDPNINTNFEEADGDYGFLMPEYHQRCRKAMHRADLTANHYVMYVNPISEDTEGLCNGTVVLDYDAIIPEGMEAFIVTSYTAGGEDDRFKTGRLNLVKVGDGDCADGYKRVIPANNPVCLRTKQTVGEGQAADKMSTTGLYPFHRNNDRTLYPCPDPNDAQYEPLELIPSVLFDGNKLRGVLDVAGQSYTAGDVLTLGRYKDNNEHKIGFWTYNGAKLNMHRVYVLKSELNIPSAAKGCTLDFGYDSTPTGIGSVGSESRVIDNGWYTLQGVRFSGKPAQSGIYIHNGKKVVVDSDSVTETGSRPTAQEEVYTDNF